MSETAPQDVQAALPAELVRIKSNKLEAIIYRRNGAHHLVQNSSLAFSRRDYRTLELVWHQGQQCELQRYFGEASPLPGYADTEDSVEKVDRCFTQPKLQSALTALEDSFFQDDDDTLLTRAPQTSAVEQLIKISALFVASPASRFAFETAALQLISDLHKKDRSKLLSEYFGDPHQPTGDYNHSSVISLARKTHGQSQERINSALNQAEEALAQGASALKIKCGHEWPEEQRFLIALRQRFPQLKLRVDFNCALSSLLKQDGRKENLPSAEAEAELKNIESALQKLTLQWVEDPGTTLRRIPIAMDEPLAKKFPTKNEIEAQNITTLVLKPMVLGSLEAIRNLNELAKKEGLALCISHLFDGPKALDFYWEIHFSLSRSVDVPGLGPHAGLEAYHQP